MYRPSVQAVPGAKVLRTLLRPRLAAPKAQYAVRSVRDALSALNVESAVNRLRSSSRPSAPSGRDGRYRRPPCPLLRRNRWTGAAPASSAVPTTRHGG
ncbi:hypothetical protein SD37_00105 [Amycolatopsis orientalis]|uniref:Uncharacterized protein n=1 Tax=Amycolatopsis orientalis TaxID=31958 RepID=A0A193BPT6_AMYOR|nr:hypothetical protein SD37_00105 [Amycolatopsis orientalis]